MSELQRLAQRELQHLLCARRKRHVALRLRRAAADAGIQVGAHGFDVELDLFQHLGGDALAQSGAGRGSGFGDEDYERAGARIVADAGAAWGADLVCKVKEPLPEELGFLRADLVVFTFLHLAAHAELTKSLVSSGCTAI